MNIAVVGTGISGLVAAYRLCTEHDVTVFEANDYPGGHTNTVDVELDGQTYSVDTGFIVFNDWTYPNFLALLDELGVSSQPTTMSFSVSDPESGIEYNGHSLNTLFAQRRNLLLPRFYRMIADILRFSGEARRFANGDDDDTSVSEFLSSRRYSRTFIDYYLLPMGSAIWSCPTGAFVDFPMRFIAAFFENHGLLSLLYRPQWRVVAGGSRTYVNALVQPFRQRIRLLTPVRRVRRFADRVEVHTAQAEPELFDHVVFACHSDQALRILADDATRREREILTAFPYVRNVAVLHTDVSLLPRARRAWASWNYRISGDVSAPPIVTYNMNLLQNLRAPHTFCVTLNDESRIDPRKILRRFEYHHPTFTATRAAAQARHHELLNANRTSFCGAYWKNGFHEDGVNSALAVVNALDSTMAGNSDSRATRTLVEMH